MKQLSIIFLLCSLPAQAAWFAYDRAIAQAMRGDVQGAHKKLEALVAEHPEDASLLYDAGVLASKNKNYEQAEAFFDQAVRHSSSTSQVHRQALFNLGNARVETEKLHEALEAYERLLTLDAENIYARHNRDKVKEMLERQQQKQQEQQKENNKNDKKQSSQQKKSQDNNAETQQENQSDNQNQEDNQGSNGSQQEQQKKSDTQQQREQGDKSSSQGQQQGAGENTQSGDAQEKSSSGDDTQAQDNQNTSKSDAQDQLDERDDYKKRYGKDNAHADNKRKQQSDHEITKNAQQSSDHQEGDQEERVQEHENSSASGKVDASADHMKAIGKAQGANQKQKEATKKYAAWAEEMLDAVQLNDEALNKILVQRAVAGSLGGREGECCW